MLTGKYGKICISQQLTKVFTSTVTKERNIAPWITKDLIKLSRKNKHLSKKAKKSNSEDHWVAYFEQHFEKEM